MYLNAQNYEVLFDDGTRVSPIDIDIQVEEMAFGRGAPRRLFEISWLSSDGRLIVRIAPQSDLRFIPRK